MEPLDEAYNHDIRLNADFRIAGEHMAGEMGAERYYEPIGKVRNTVANLKPGDAQRFATDIANGSPFLRRKLLGEVPVVVDHKIHGWSDESGAEIDELTRGARLTRALRDTTRDSGQSEYTVANGVVLNLAEWLAHRTQISQAELDQDSEKMKLRYKSAIEARREEERLPEEVLDRLVLLDSVDVLVDDRFSTNHDYPYPSDGWYLREYEAMGNHDKATVVLSPRLSGTERDHVVNHEFTHAISSSLETSLDREALLSTIFGGFGATVMNEALTEHWTARALHGDFDKVAPDHGTEDVYGSFRILLDTLCNRGKEKIDIRDMYHALYFSEFDHDAPILEDVRIVALCSKLDKAFPGIDVAHEMSLLKKGNNQTEDDRIVREFTRKLIDIADGYMTPDKAFDRGGKISRGLAHANVMLLKLHGMI